MRRSEGLMAKKIFSLGFILFFILSIYFYAQKAKIEDIFLNPKENSLVSVEGIVIQHVEDNSYMLRDDWGGIIKITALKSKPQVSVRYSVTGYIKIDTSTGDPFILEKLRLPGEILNVKGGYIEIDLGEDEGLRPGKKIIIFIKEKGQNLKIAEGNIAIILGEKSVVELTRIWRGEFIKRGALFKLQ